MIINATLTGNLRYRRNWRRKKILQVEESGFILPYRPVPPKQKLKRFLRWRDAVAEDVAQFPQEIDHFIQDEMSDSNDHILTGKVRYRINWRGQMILQVEEWCWFLPTGLNPPWKGDWYPQWRDGRPQDAVGLAKLHSSFTPKPEPLSRCPPRPA